MTDDEIDAFVRDTIHSAILNSIPSVKNDTCLSLNDRWKIGKQLEWTARRFDKKGIISRKKNNPTKK